MHVSHRSTTNIDEDSMRIMTTSMCTIQSSKNWRMYLVPLDREWRRQYRLSVVVPVRCRHLIAQSCINHNAKYSEQRSRCCHHHDNIVYIVRARVHSVHLIIVNTAKRLPTLDHSTHAHWILSPPAGYYHPPSPRSLSTDHLAHHQCIAVTGLATDRQTANTG